jgi:HD-GYP domain-containing protein (c-di-GMP phosphodiesterase class II)
VPEAILNKSAALGPEELARMRAHPAIGAEILRGLAFLEASVPAVRHHHERWDGRGYPGGLAGESIPLVARVINAADTFDACTSVRPYQAPLPVDRALEVLAVLRGKQIDPVVCDALVQLARRTGSEVTSIRPLRPLAAATAER